MTAPISRTQLLGLLAISLAATSVAAQGLLTTQGQVVAEAGDTAIGAPEPFGTTSPLDAPVMDRNGLILFRGTMIGAGVTTLTNRALFMGHTKGDLKMFLQAGDIDPSGTYPNSVLEQMSGSTGLPLGSNIFSTQRISPRNSYVMFGAQLYNAMALDPIVHTGATTQNHTLLYWGIPGSTIQILAQQNTTTMPDGAILTAPSFGQQGTALNSSGVVAFKNSLQIGSGTPAVASGVNDEAWFTATFPGPLSYMIRKGDAIPAAGGGTLFQLGSNCVLNENGDMLHDERLSLGSGSPAVTAGDDNLLLITTAGTHNILMREGDTAPDENGVPIAGVLYGSPTIAQGFSNTGKTAFVCNPLTGPGVTTGVDDVATFAGGIGSVKLVARKGDLVPSVGEPWGVIFTSLHYCDDLGATVQGNMVQNGTTVVAANDSVLCIGHSRNDIQLIAREGTPAPGLPGFFWGNTLGSFSFGSSVSVAANEIGQMVFSVTVNDGTANVGATYSYDRLHGLQVQLLQGDVFGANTVNSNLGGPPTVNPSGDGNSLGMNGNGDFVIKPGVSVPSASSFIVRGHVGSLQGLPSAVPATGGVPHFLSIDTTSTHQFNFYIVLATGLGTDPGFPYPFNPSLTVPLNWDTVWSQLSFDLVNSPVWGNTLYFTDVDGKATAAFNMPAGYPAFLGTTLHHAALLFDLSLTGTFVTEPVPCYLY